VDAAAAGTDIPWGEGATGRARQVAFGWSQSAAASGAVGRAVACDAAEENMACLHGVQNVEEWSGKLADVFVLAAWSTCCCHQVYAEQG